MGGTRGAANLTIRGAAAPPCLFVFNTSFDNVYVEQSADPIVAAIASAITVAGMVVVVLLDRFVGLRSHMYVG